MLHLNYDYASCVRNAEKVCWTVDEVMPPDTPLDFSRPFLPAALAGRMPDLRAEERLALNQITGNAYLNLFVFVEEYIIATMMKQAQAELGGDRDALRALVRFAEEELKHQQLFNRYLAAFKQSFGHECGVLDSAKAVAGVILTKTPMAVMMLTLHLEIMTQAHYTESVKDDTSLEPLFARLLKHHWMEEAQHAKIDALELDRLTEDATPEQIAQAFDDYLELVDAIDDLLAQQARMDEKSFASAAGRKLADVEAAAVTRAQHTAYRNTFLVLGMRNPVFMNVLEILSSDGARRVADKVATLS
jgi:hypothetical protein